MKLLKLEIGDLQKEKQFRSLHAGFKVEFHSLDDKGIKAMDSFSPFCFAGLNGSGKSNVLEALAAIYYHLECCVAIFTPESFKKHFRPNECNPDAFTLEYLIGRPNNSEYVIPNLFKIIIIKELGKAPKLFRQAFPFSENEMLIEESLEPPKKKGNQEPAPAKIYLPDIIAGYSSGENEILSLPFRKSRLLNFDKYREDSQESRPFVEPENSLIYIDAEMSQTVLLACLLYEDEEALKPLKKELGIIGLKSFRMNLNNHELHKNKDSKNTIAALNHCKDSIEKLKKCATSWQQFDLNILYTDGTSASNLILDFFVDDN
jgi:restriction system-associated AAA family ATPase